MKLGPKRDAARDVIFPCRCPARLGGSSFKDIESGHREEDKNKQGRQIYKRKTKIKGKTKIKRKTRIKAKTQIRGKTKIETETKRSGKTKLTTLCHSGVP